MKSFGSKPWMLPQPVLIIGTYDKDGKPNAMNAAWGGTWDMHEIIISLASHATTDNLEATGEFTVAFATRDTLVAADFVGIVSARNDAEKMAKTGWTIEKAPNVNAPVFREFPMTMECKVLRKIDESETGYYLVAEVVNILRRAIPGRGRQPRRGAHAGHHLRPCASRVYPVGTNRGQSLRRWQATKVIP